MANWRKYGPAVSVTLRYGALIGVGFLMAEA